MARITAWIEAFALSVGGPGLFIIAFLDSSFLSFPEVNDLLIVLMVINHPQRMPFYATMATLGSVAGCLALYYVGRRGAATRCFRSGSKAGWWSALGPDAQVRRDGADRPALLPPPAPFKIFVLLGGVANIPLRTFVCRSRSDAASGTSARGFWRCSTASRRSTTSTKTAGRSAWCWASRARRWCRVLRLEKAHAADLKVGTTTGVKPDTARRLARPQTR
jgi:hypothetical protein